MGVGLKTNCPDRSGWRTISTLKAATPGRSTVSLAADQENKKPPGRRAERKTTLKKSE